jgi:hypothetical protein
VEQEFEEASRAPCINQEDGDEDTLVQIVDPAEKAGAASQDCQRIHRSGPPRVLSSKTSKKTKTQSRKKSSMKTWFSSWIPHKKKTKPSRTVEDFLPMPRPGI